MKKFLFLLFIASYLLTMLSCQKKTIGIQTDKDDMQISISMQSGWCSGSDSLLLNADKSVVIYKTTCKDDPKTESFSINKSDWNALTSVLDKDTFESIHLDACGVCYDGTDYRVTVKQGHYTHSIRFDHLSYKNLDPIRPFIEKLLEFRKRYKLQLAK